MAKTVAPGLIFRVLAHGTVMVWDTERSRSYPYYGAGTQEFTVGESVLFSTDAKDTIVVELVRVSAKSEREK